MGKDQDLLESCRTGNVLVVEKLLAGRLNAKRGSKASIGGGALSTLSKSLLSLKNANVNCADGSGETPLHLAALNGHKEIVSMLLECDASPTILDTQDCSPLHLAAWNGHTEICSQLLQAPNGHTLINLQTREGNTALHFAAQHGHSHTLLYLLQNQADPTIRSLEDLSPVDLAAQYDRLDIVKQLITSHPELVAQRSFTNTPLHLASRNGHRAVVQFLLDSGFPIDAKTDKGTALHEAANFCKLDVIKLLLERGIDITVKSQTDCTAEDILRSIPSKAAEEALNILKSHIYHQRTPDSDGERGIVADSSCPPPAITSINQDAHHYTKAPASTTSVEKKANLISLPQNSSELSLPPPIPPRQSVRDLGRNETGEPGLAPIRMPSEREVSSDEDKNKLTASPRDISPSARSPSNSPFHDHSTIARL
ncbi:Ankyrin repeat and sterile alpha motif domain-containing protein 1B [Bulinus truncatus]|nr:Ankyrin repeat and sterile alpha motif domain-containing protein 1B [Bulinus truncatus]